jgi:hypothetical protein
MTSFFDFQVDWETAEKNLSIDAKGIGRPLIRLFGHFISEEEKGRRKSNSFAVLEDNNDDDKDNACRRDKQSILDVSQ